MTAKKLRQAFFNKNYYVGLEEQGLYRVVGVASKVTRLLTMGLDRRKTEKLNLEDGIEWESKTITSAIKTFFRNLPQPIMTFKTHQQFIAAASTLTGLNRSRETNSLPSYFFFQSSIRTRSVLKKFVAS
jgi:hypothetical protein